MVYPCFYLGKVRYKFASFWNRNHVLRTLQHAVKKYHAMLEAEKKVLSSTLILIFLYGQDTSVMMSWHILLERYTFVLVYKYDNIKHHILYISRIKILSVYKFICSLRKGEEAVNIAWFHKGEGAASIALLREGEEAVTIACT